MSIMLITFTCKTYLKYIMKKILRCSKPNERMVSLKSSLLGSGLRSREESPNIGLFWTKLKINRVEDESHMP